MTSEDHETASLNVRIAEGQRFIHDLLKADSLHQRTVPARQSEGERATRHHDAARYQRASPHAGKLARRIFDRRNQGVSRRNTEQTTRADRNRVSRTRYADVVC